MIIIIIFNKTGEGKSEGCSVKKQKNDICETLWLENEPALRRLCRVKMQSCPDDIDDVISEVFLALCRNVSENNIPENPKAWLYGALNNIIKTKYRKIYSLKNKRTSLSDEQYELPYEYGGIEEKIDELYSNEIWSKLKSLLSDEEYQLLKNIHYNGLKMKEIAQMNNTTESAIKQKHYRICNKLRKILKSPDELF